MNGKALRKHSMHTKKTASVLLKLFISGDKGCHTTDAPLAPSKQIRYNDTPTRGDNEVILYRQTPSCC